MAMPRDLNAGRNHKTNIGHRSFERVEKLKYLGTILTNQNYIREEIKNRFKSGNAESLFSSLPSKKLNIKIYRIIILPVVLNGVKVGRSH
jgi:hypothetical protein